MHERRQEKNLLLQGFIPFTKSMRKNPSRMKRIITILKLLQK